MNLKESYRYMNYLTQLQESAEKYLWSKDFITYTEEKHLRKKVNTEANDEIIQKKPEDLLEVKPIEVVNFVLEVIHEKEALSTAISEAKKDTEIDIDKSITMNKTRQNFISNLRFMSKIKDSETQKRGTDYKFNADGEQVSYYYDIIENVYIDYDREKIKDLVRNLKKECDDISTKLDMIQLCTEVCYTPKWHIDDLFEDVILE